jgi:hypothetical protein
VFDLGHIHCIRTCNTEINFGSTYVIEPLEYLLRPHFRQVNGHFYPIPIPNFWGGCWELRAACFPVAVCALSVIDGKKDYFTDPTVLGCAVPTRGY